MKRFVRLIPLLFLIDACVDPLDLNFPIGPSTFVVDGMITSDPGPYQVKLFYSGRLSDPTMFEKAETKASVWIMSDAGENEKLTETQLGTYSTSAMGIRGQIGRSYSLRILTSKNQEYKSTAQVMAPAGQIDNLYVEFEQNSLVPNNKTKGNDSFSIYVDAHGEASASNFFRWRWANTFKGRTFPELHIPAPLPCSGYVIDCHYPTCLRKIAECTCCICWGTEQNSNAIISDNRFVSDQVFSKVLLAELAITPMRFYEKYYIAVEQLSISPDVYEFWKLVAALQQSTGSLFQPNSVKVKGNVMSVTNPQEEVFGIFSASAIARKTLFIDKSQIPFPVAPLDSSMYDCREILIRGTTEKPPFW